MFDNEFSWLNNKTIAFVTSVWPSGAALEEMAPAPSLPAVDGNPGGSGDVVAQMAAVGDGELEGNDGHGINLPPAIGEYEKLMYTSERRWLCTTALCHSTSALCHSHVSDSTGTAVTCI